MYTTLLLTPWMSPHRVLAWEDAIVLVYLDKVDVLETYPEVVRSPSTAMQMPAVVRLRRHVPPVKRGVKFSRVNVFTRDGYRCQFCGKKKPARELNYDHVVPRVQGGKTVWENIVTACAGPNGCNAKKAGRTPEQAGMRLIRQPLRPKSLPICGPLLPDLVPEPWKPYLQDVLGVTA